MLRYLILILLYLVTAALPLSLQVGTNLEYEYALLASYSALVLLPLAGVLGPLRLTPSQAGAYRPNYAFEVFWIFLLSPLVAVAPGAALLLSKTCRCSGPGFAFWMVVLWYPAWILAHALMHLAIRLRFARFSRRLVGLALAASYLAVTAAVAAQLWLAPQKHLMDPLLGFWHGPIYDAYISVDHGLILARASHLALAATLLFVAWLRLRFVSIAAVVLGLGFTVTAGLYADDFPSTKNDQATLDALLPGTHRGTGYVLHYQPSEAQAGRPSGMPLEVQRFQREIEFHLSELRDVLAEGGAPLPEVQIYAYPSRDDKKRWFGAGATDVTDVHTPSVHVTTETWPHPTLRHELVHALASGFGYKGLGFHPNMAFTEGLAVALAPQQGALTLDQASADLLLNKRLPALETLFTPAFWTVAGEKSYTVAGSLLRYLIAKQGIAGVKALYSGKSWQEAFGQPREALVAAWQEQAVKGYDPQVNALYTAALFSDPGVLYDQCPHSKADLSISRSSNIYVRMRQLVGWDPDHDYLPYLAQLDPDDRSLKVQLWRDELKRVAAGRVIKGEDLARLRNQFAVARHSPATSLADIEMGISEADILKLSGDTGGSVLLLTQLAAEGKKRFFGASLTREIEARLAIDRDEAHIASIDALEWRRYLAGWRRGLPSAAVQIHEEPWILSYLKLRNERETNLTSGQLHRLLTEVAVNQELSPSFHHEWYKVIAERLMRLNAFRDAEAAYAKAAAASPPATREVYEQYSRRARFYAKAGLTASAGSGEKR